MGKSENVPCSLEMFGHTYVVEYRDGMPEDATIGLCNPADTVISINKNIAPSMQEVTLLHEIVEAVSIMNELNLPHPHITCLATNLYHILKENNLYFPSEEKD